MGDESHVGLVDAHAERDRRHHDDTVFAKEALLRAPAHTRVESRVIRQRVDAAFGQVPARSSRCSRESA